VLRHPDVSRASPLAVSKYLTFEYVPAPHSIFAAVRKLEPGHWLLLDLAERRLEVRQYWELPLLDDALNYQREDDYADELRERLSEAVRIRLVSDVPIGVFLSGGIDSQPCLAALTGPLEAFTVVSATSFDGTAVEILRAPASSSRRHCDLDTVLPEIPDILNCARRAARRLVAIFQPSCSRASSPPHRCARRRRRRRHPRRLSDLHRAKLVRTTRSFRSRSASQSPGATRAGVARQHRFDFRIKRCCAAPASPRRYVSALMASRDKKRTLSPGVCSTISSQRLRGRARAHQPQQPATTERALSRAKLYLQDDILVRSTAPAWPTRSRCARHFSTTPVERRPPSRAPPADAPDDQVPAQGGRRPAAAALVRRPKKGFACLSAAGSTAPALVDAALRPERLRSGGLFDPAFVAALLAEHRAGVRDNRKLLWTLFAFQTGAKAADGQPSAGRPLVDRDRRKRRRAAATVCSAR
jgi:asparagine synthase (glutamine-hydrolysing)